MTTGLLSRLRRRLPRRRRRLWRYVSGRRRRVGLFLFALLVLVAGGYWYLTNDARVQRKVEQYLHRLTGAEVKIESARFSLFGGIQVRNLQIRAADGKIPFFESPEVFISHRPSALLLRGALEPTKIICVGATVRPVLDLRSGRWNWPATGQVMSADGKKREMPLVSIYLRDAELEIIEVLDGNRFRRPKVPMSASLIPDPEKKMYNVILADEAGTIQGRGTIDMATGRADIKVPSLQEAGLVKVLPKQWLDWKKRYKLTFRKPWDVTISLVGSSTATAPAGSDQLIVDLKDVSMELPAEEGGLKFTGVSGRIVFDRAGVAVENLAGRVAQAGGANFTLHGRYDGYGPDSPFHTSLTITEMGWPLGEDLTRLCGEAFAKFHEQIDPSGPISLHATLRRDREGRLQVEGQAELKGLSLRLPYWPIRLTGVTGRITLAENALQLTGLRGRCEGAEVAISGRVVGPMDNPTYDLRIVAHDLPLVPAVRDALPTNLRKIWDALSPRGQATFTIHIAHSGESAEPAATVVIDLDSKTSFEYSGFPYRLERLVGQVVISPAGTRIHSVRGSAGAMRCLLNGEVAPGGGRSDFRISAEVTDLPLDERLARALSGRIRKAYVSYGLSGRADITKATIWRKNGGPVNCDIPVAVRDAGIRHSGFPYQIEGVTGTVRITSDEVTVQRLVGRHGRANINISGSVPIRPGRRGMDLTIEASDLALDSALRNALPPDARHGWDLLSPAGVANVTMTLRRDGFDRPTTASAPSTTRPAVSYHLLVRPRDMRIKYRHFPFLLRFVAGEAVIEPEIMTLKSLRGLAGGAEVVLDGRISIGRGNEQADLRIHTGAIALDRQFLSALPAELVRALELRPGGTASVSLTSLRVRRAAPASQPATGPASRPAGRLAWRWAGRIAFNDAATVLGMGDKRLTGWIEGEMACQGRPEKLTAEADIFIETLVVGPRRLNKITGHLHKAAGSPMLRIDKISGRVFGGRVAGFAHVRLAKPKRYGLSLSVENINLAELLKSEAKDPRRDDVIGLLTGNIQMTATVGDRASRQATGRLHISRAKLYKLPVLLGFLHVVNLTLPSESAFHSGEVSYYLSGNTLTFREIHLQGSALSMLGAGTMDIKTEKLDLTFLTGPPRKLPRLAALSDVLEGIASQLMTVRVTGTLSKPRVKTAAFRDMDTILRELHRPGAK